MSANSLAYNVALLVLNAAMPAFAVAFEVVNALILPNIVVLLVSNPFIFIQIEVLSFVLRTANVFL